MQRLDKIKAKTEYIKMALRSTGILYANGKT